LAVPAGHASVKLAVVRVSGSIASLKLAEISVLSATPVAPATGTVELTVGAVVSGVAPVVKLQVKALARALPATSLATVVIVAVQMVLAGRLLDGVKVATLPLTAYPTVPVLAVPAGHASVKLAVVRVSGSIASLKLAEISVLSATPVAPAAGTVELTVGAVVSGMAPVVKVQVKGLARALPATSLAPVVIVAVQMVLAGRMLASVKVAKLPLAV
jgi:hypothetical protein